MTKSNAIQQPHTTTIHQSRRKRRTLFYATCSCGELHGPPRATVARAERDALDHVAQQFLAGAEHG
jgi:uncharacterized OB-fold protein